MLLPSSGMIISIDGCLSSPIVRIRLKLSEACKLLVRHQLPLTFIHSIEPFILENLLDIEQEETIESKWNLFRFYNYVKHLLPNPEVNLMLAASKTLGKIADIGGSAFGERFMDYEVPAAIELMQQEAPRHAGVLILKELARHSANYFHSHIGIVFENILVPLRDQRSIVREGAAELLAACLEIVTQRERQARTHDLSKILQDAQLGLRQSQSEVIHGSLLTYRELLLHAGMVSKLTSSP